jgi:cytochrome P450
MTDQARKVPAHVPPELVWDRSFDGFLAEMGDPFLAGARLHDGPAVIWASTAAHGNPAWIITRHTLIEEAFTDHASVSSARGANAAVMDSDWLLLPVEADKPNHHYYRQVLHPFLTPSAVGQRVAALQELCDTLVGKFIDRGSCEFISEFSELLPNTIVISLLGMPAEMLPQFLKWEHEIIHGADNAIRLAASVAVIDYLKAFIAGQKGNPATEVMAAILNGHVRDRPFTDAEVLGMVYLLFVAGLDTVNSSLGWIMRQIATDQALQQRLRDNPEEIPAAIDEFTRAFGVSSPSRTVTRDMVFHGVTMKKGESVLLPTFLAGRDPRAWPSPHVIDIARKPRHLTFGTGPHVCLGVHLAKREMRIMLETFLSRMHAIRIPEGGRFEYHTTNTLGVDRLDLVWNPA